MVTLDLNQKHSLDEVLEHIESGEIVQLKRGDQVVATVCGADPDIREWTKLSAEQLAKALSAEDFTNWNPPHDAR
jgi:hypothetical protein